MIHSHGFSDSGCVRTENQDRILIDQELGLYVIADGMGGHHHGEMAAELAISTLRFYVESSHDRSDVTWPYGYSFELGMDSNRLVTGIRLTNRQVWKRAEEKPECTGMGTTVAAMLVTESRAAVGNVGDSRVYLLRGGEWKQLTIDDTWISEVLRHGPGQTELLNHPMRNVLTQAAGSQHDVNVHACEFELRDRDLLVMSSDGLHGVVPDSRMRELISADAPLEEIGERLLEAARAEGGPDNVSVILLRYTGE